MNIFLTGHPGVGKSTIIKKTLAELNIVPSGFYTLAGKKDKNGGSDVYIHEASNQDLLESTSNRVGHRVGDGVNYEAFPQTFDTIGVKILQNATLPLIVMDELGFMENNALLFQKLVLKTLDGNIPVIGVIKPKDTAFLNQVKQHPKTKLIEITEANRDEMLLELIDILKELHIR